MKIDDAKTRESNLLQRNVSERTSVFTDRNRTEIVYLSVDQLTPYRKQARVLFDEREINALADTISAHGIRQPLTVLRVDFDTPRFEIVSGERRYRAAKKLGLKRIPCIIIEDADQAEEIALIENIQRQDLHPVELATSLKSLVDKKGWGGQTELEKTLGIAQSKVSELLRLLNLSEKVRGLLLSLNYRGRDNLRKICSLQTELEQITFIEKSAAGVKSEEGIDKKTVDKRAKPCLSVRCREGEFFVESRQLIKMTVQEKKDLIEVLTNVILDIEADI